MAEQVGEIYFEVNADTDQLMGSVSAVDSATNRMAKSFTELDRALGKTDSNAAALAQQFGGSGKAAAALENEIRRLGGAILENGNVVDRYGVRNAKMTQTLGQLRGATFQTTKGFRMMRGGMQQIGYQVQDVAVQLQMGQNALMVLGQQGSQVASLFGAGGAVFGAVLAISAALGTALVPSLFDSTTATEKLEDAMKKLGDAVEIDDGVARLTDEIRELAEVSEEAARAQLAQEIVDAQRAIGAAADGIGDKFGGISNAVESVGQQFHLYRQALDDGTTAQEGLSLGVIETTSPISKLQQVIFQMNKELGLSSEQSYRLLEAFMAVKNSRTAESIQNLQNVTGQLASEFDYSNEALGDFNAGMSTMFSEGREAGQILEYATKASGMFGEEVKNSSDEVSNAGDELAKLVSTVQLQAKTIGMSEREQAIYTATLLNAGDAVKKDINDAYDRIEAYQTLTVTQKELNAANQQAANEWQGLIAKLQNQERALLGSDEAFEMFIDDLWESGVAAGKSADDIQRLVDRYRDLRAEQQKSKDEDLAKTLGVSDEVAIQQQLDQQLIELDRLKKEGLLANEADYQDRRERLIEEANEKIAKLNDSAYSIDWESFGNQAIGAFSAVATGAMDGREAIRGLAMSLAQEAIGSLIRMALFGDTMRAKETSAGVTQAATLTSAYAPAAAAASTATAGGAATAGLTAMSMAIPAMMAMFAVGGRKYGGAVAAGSMYEVAEGGKPEMYISGNRSYLLPSANGQVVSNKDMMGGGGSKVEVNVRNYSGQNVDVQTSQKSGVNTPTDVINIVVGDMRKRGRVHQAMTETTTANNRTRG